MINEALLSSNSNEHYTPLDVVTRVLEFYDGIIDLDPSSNTPTGQNPNVPALFHYTPLQDGLTLPWAGKVYVNPPYGTALSTWVDKVISEYESDRAREILLLVPSRTDTKWFHNLNSYPRLYFKGRLKFVAEGNKSSAPFPSALFYLGGRIGRFSDYWKDWGKVDAGDVKQVTGFNKVLYQREYMRKIRAEAKAKVEASKM